ncbi:UNVERIFIED_CONTAM: hypothetical protein FKN15_000387 [Acipenser sinensis]
MPSCVVIGWLLLLLPALCLAAPAHINRLALFPDKSAWCEAKNITQIVTLDCPGNKEMPRVDKLVEKILHCSCQSCGILLDEKK